jgi:FkbM family methyltransferase
MHPALNNYLKLEEEVFRKAWKICSDSPPGLVFDIGANEGFTTAYFLNMKANKIIAIEPDPAAFQKLTFRFGKNKRVRLHHEALGEKTGKFPFFQVSPASGYNTFSEKWYRQHQMQQSKILEVNMVPISSIFQRYGVPDLIKIDVEGMEWEVIKSIQLEIPMISFEANLPIFAYNTKRILKHLTNLLPLHLLYASSDNMLSESITFSEAIELCDAPQARCIEFFFIRPKGCIIEDVPQKW